MLEYSVMHYVSTRQYRAVVIPAADDTDPHPKLSPAPPSATSSLAGFADCKWKHSHHMSVTLSRQVKTNILFWTSRVTGISACVKCHTRVAQCSWERVQFSEWSVSKLVLRADGFGFCVCPLPPSFPFPRLLLSTFPLLLLSEPSHLQPLVM